MSSIPEAALGRKPFPLPVRTEDGEGSVQVRLDPADRIEGAKVFAVYGKGGIGKSRRRRRICPSRSRSSVSACCRSAAIRSTTRLSRSRRSSCRRSSTCSSPSSSTPRSCGSTTSSTRATTASCASRRAGRRRARAVAATSSARPSSCSKQHHLLEDTDVVIFDVLGDVVCGGFAARRYSMPSGRWSWPPMTSIRSSP